IMLGFASNAMTLFAAWCVLGLGMGLGLYDAAFAALVYLHGSTARRPITGITLIAGFASTVGWPLTAYMAEHYGWRASCFAWAAMHIAIALPINLACIPRAAHKQSAVDSPDSNADTDDSVQSTSSKRGYRRAFFL